MTLVIRSPAGVAGTPAPAWVIVTACPPTVRVPVLDDVPVCAAIPKLTVPLPLPLAPLLIVIQVPERVAVHEQPAAAATVTLPVALDALNDRLVGETV